MMSDLDLFHKELKQIQKIPGIDTDHSIASKQLSILVKKQLLTYDILKNPEKFFAFHAAISEYIGLEGFGIRFTVQYNLFAGSLIALRTNYHHNSILSESQKNGDLGCFMLTEYAAGVSSGMICNTIATMAGDRIIINTPGIVYDHSSDLPVIGQPMIDFERTIDRKNWISQAMYAKYGIVIARLIIDSVDHGIQPFLVEMNQPGIYIKSNGNKTIAQSLDNCMVVFNNLVLHKNSLMHSSDHHSLVQLRQNPGLGFKRIANRLNSGRLCIALSMSRFLSMQCKAIQSNTFNKTVYFSKSKQSSLNSLPALQCILRDNTRLLSIIIQYVDKIVSIYCQKIKTGKEFDNEFLESIIVAKVITINFGYKMMNDLKVRMGANSLFAEKGMGANDILLCARFAEGDNDILLGKLMTDRIKKLDFKSMHLFDYIWILLEATFRNNDLAEEKYLLLELFVSMLSDKKFKNIDEIVEKMDSCKSRIVCNIVNTHTKTKISIKDIKSML
jgi:acyl-CoA oxidase